jgi:ankyrin repeat protein
VEEVKKYLDQYTNDLVNKLEAQSRQPSLYFSVLIADPNKSYEIMKMLIDHGANPNFKDQYIQTVFFYTCREGTRMIFSGKEKCFDLLLDLGVVID